MENQMKDNAGSPSVESLVKRGCLFLEDSEWNKADEYFDKALDINPEHAPAYIGKLCVELMVRREESLGDYNELRQGKKFDKLLGEYGNFQKALRFADDDYKKKLNGYDQKIKENFPKTIPQRFTDEFVNGEIARLEKEIANCDAEITKNKQASDFWKSEAQRANGNKQKMVEQQRSINTNVWGVSTYEEAWKDLKDDSSFKSYGKEETDCYDKKGKADELVYEYKDKKTKYEAIKLELEQLAGISCLDRMDVYYNRVVKDMQKASTEDEFKSLAEQFRSLEGYKDSAELADKYGKLVIKAQYDKLVQEKNKAATEEKYRELSKQFRDMGGYESSAKLADECDKLADECVKQKEREKKARYDALVQAKSGASTEDKYRQLTQDFREMGNYENAVQLANECDKQMNILKKQREEQERQEQARIAVREAAEREETERRNRYREKKEKLKKSTGLLIQFGILFVYLFLLWGTRLIYHRFYSIRESILIIIFPAVLSLVFGIISRLFLKDAKPKLGLPWGTVFLLFGLAATTVTGSVWDGGGIVRSIISVILALISIFSVPYIWAESEGIFSSIGKTLGVVVATAIVGGIIGGASNNNSLFIFIGLVIPAIPGIIIMHKTEGAELF